METPSRPSTSSKSKRTPAAKRSLDVALGAEAGTPKAKKPRPNVNQALWKHFTESTDDLDYAICQIPF